MYMNNLIQKRFAFLVVLLAISPFLVSWNPAGMLFVSQFKVEESSKLYLMGSTNVNTFRCDCKEQFGAYGMEMQESGSGQKIQFSNTTLQIASSRFDCGNRMMNKDMYATLKGDKHPHIQIELLDAIHTTGKTLAKSSDWVHMKATTAISIAGVRKVVAMDVMGKTLSANRYQFRGSRDVRLSDYQLKAPSPMMGLVQVHDAITIHLDLVVKII